MKAIKIVSAGKAEIQDVAQPELLEDRVLAKVNAVALNPTDWKHIDYLATPGSTVGCDFSGTVVEVGSKCTKGYKVGDRIAGITHGSNANDLNSGCFAEYAVVKEGASYKVPENLSSEEAATSSVGIITVSMALYQKLALPFPGEGKSDEWILIYGGSTATGSLAIQYAKLSGCKVATTCSPRNFDFVKSLGADIAIDYNDAECGKKINEATEDKLRLAFDCVSEGSSPEICCAAISSQGGKAVYLLQAKCKLKVSEMASQAVLVATFLFFVLRFGAEAATITVRNNCPRTIWPATLTSGPGQPQLSTTGFELAPGASRSFNVPAPWTGRVWARTRCSNNGGRFTCLTGDCGRGLSCNGAGGVPPATLAEFTVAPNGGQDFYDVSLVDGFNIPATITTQGGTGPCRSSNCRNDVNRVCPGELQVRSGNEVIGCKSACFAFNQPQYCCTGAFNDPNKCRPTNYSMIFENQCPDAYSYAYDDKNSTFTCNNRPNYVITFCG